MSTPYRDPQDIQKHTRHLVQGLFATASPLNAERLIAEVISDFDLDSLDDVELIDLVEDIRLVVEQEIEGRCQSDS